MSDKIVTRLQELKGKTLRRNATTGAVDMAARTVELSFSSETEKVERYYGIEVLDHSPGACRLERLNDNAPGLWNHDWDDMRSVVVAGSARVDSDRKGRATLRFSRSPAGEQMLQDINDGIVTKVSVGYLTHGMKLSEERDGIDVYTITDWEPYEISMVSIPADNDVGVGRALENPQVDQTRAVEENSTVKHVSTDIQLSKAPKNMITKNLRNPATGDFVTAEVDEAGAIVRVLAILELANADITASSQRGAETERARVRAIAEMGKTYGKPEIANQFIADGKSPDDFRRELLDGYAKVIEKKPLSEVRSADIGLNDSEVARFSIMRAIRSLANPNDTQLRKEAAFEFEASAAAARLYGKEPKGITIPNDVLSRAFSTAGVAGGTGQALIANELMTGSFISLLRKRTWVMRRARVLSGLVGNVDVPRQNATGGAYWIGEGQGPTAGTPGTDQIAFTPKTVGATTDITRRLMNQSSLDAESLVRDDILNVMALELDRVAIYGTGSVYQPKGLSGYSGINAVNFGTAGQPTFAELVQMETEIAMDNADVESMSYAFNAAMRGYMKTKVKFASAGSATIWEQGNTVNGYATDVSNQIVTNDTFFGNWQDLVIAMWGGLELTVDPFALSTSGGVRLIALQDVDMNLRRVESFCVGR